MFAGIPIGVAYAQEPAITVAITTALGSAPRLFARETAIGIINAVVAVFDIKFVSAQVTMNITRRSRIGFGSPAARHCYDMCALPTLYVPVQLRIIITIEV